MIIFVDGNNNKIFLKDVNLSCPSFDPVMSGIYDINKVIEDKLPSYHWIFSSFNGARL